MFIASLGPYTAVLKYRGRVLIHVTDYSIITSAGIVGDFCRSRIIC